MFVDGRTVISACRCASRHVPAVHANRRFMCVSHVRYIPSGEINDEHDDATFGFAPVDAIIENFSFVMPHLNYFQKSVASTPSGKVPKYFLTPPLLVFKLNA